VTDLFATDGGDGPSIAVNLTNTNWATMNMVNIMNIAERIGQ
jgi:hypothetical protein